MKWNAVRSLIVSVVAGALCVWVSSGCVSGSASDEAGGLVGLGSGDPDGVIRVVAAVIEELEDGSIRASGNPVVTFSNGAKMSATTLSYSPGDKHSGVLSGEGDVRVTHHQNELRGRMHSFRVSDSRLLEFVERKPVPAVKAQGGADGVYRVESGDTLETIALRFYGQRDQWRRIYNANKDRLGSKARLKPGDLLVIPSAPGDPEEK